MEQSPKCCTAHLHKEFFYTTIISQSVRLPALINTSFFYLWISPLLTLTSLPQFPCILNDMFVFCCRHLLNNRIHCLGQLGHDRSKLQKNSTIADSKFEECSILKTVPARCNFPDIEEKSDVTTSIYFSRHFSCILHINQKMRITGPL